MRPINAKATAVFRLLIAGLNKPGDAKKIESESAGIMPLSIDYLRTCKQGNVYSVAHNYVQNGDVMADPDMEFLVAADGIYPMTFQQDNLGLYQVAMRIEDGQLHLNEKLQADLASFVNQWLGINVPEQFGKKYTA